MDADDPQGPEEELRPVRARAVQEHPRGGWPARRLLPLLVLCFVVGSAFPAVLLLLPFPAGTVVLAVCQCWQSTSLKSCTESIWPAMDVRTRRCVCCCSLTHALSLDPELIRSPGETSAVAMLLLLLLLPPFTLLSTAKAAPPDQDYGRTGPRSAEGHPRLGGERAGAGRQAPEEDGPGSRAGRRVRAQLRDLAMSLVQHSCCCHRAPRGGLTAWFVSQMALESPQRPRRSLGVVTLFVHRGHACYTPAGQHRWSPGNGHRLLLAALTGDWFLARYCCQARPHHAPCQYILFRALVKKRRARIAFPRV